MPYSASAMFVTHGIPSFYEQLRKCIYNFSERISSSSNSIIKACLSPIIFIFSPISRHVNRKKEKSLKLADHLPRLNFLTFLTAQRNSGASGEVIYRYLKFISCNFFLKLFIF